MREHIDFRKLLPDSKPFCIKCGDVYLTNWIENIKSFGLVCINCGDIKIED